LDHPRGPRVNCETARVIERPVFVVAPPRSGGTALFRSLARAPGLFSASVPILDGVFELQPENREWDSNRLTAADIQPRAVEDLRGRLKGGLVDSAGNRPGIDASGLRWVDGQPRNALRVPFLAGVAPDAQFVYIHRDPAETIPAMLQVWESGRRVSYTHLPDWEGPAWSLPLVPGWRELAGKPLPEIVTEQWLRLTGTLLDDLEVLPPERWCVTDFKTLLNDPKRELERICEFVALEASDDVTRPLRSLRDQLAVSGEQQEEVAEELRDLLPRTEQLAERSRELLARPTTPPRTAQWSAPADSPLRSVYTQNFPEFLNQLGSSLLVSTYQTGKLICARYDGGQLNTHFRNFPRPMGLAVGPGRIAIGTRAEVLDYRDFPAVAAKVEPQGKHDACFLPRNKHFTGDIRIHEIEYAQGELWLVATNFSCLATLNAEHSFVPRWKPPFISQLTAEDRCHLNGLCVIDDEPRYVTALGETDVAGGWRENKANGGVLIDIESGETVLRGLSMPHSPRWYDGKMWVLESGKGTISVADLDAGTTETVAELPGFTRGLLFAGGLALIGLSQVRETATFGGLPLMERLDERLCGVWAVNPQTGQIAGFLRFEEQVQEVFDLELLSGIRYPEIAEEGSDAATNSFMLPEAVTQPG
jgi:uncharacterized protein (TIGR03032 family)